MRNKTIFGILLSFMVLMFCFADVLPAVAQEDQSADFIFKGKLVIGKIKEVDVAENLVKVDSDSGELMEFVFIADETVVWIDDDEKGLSDIESGMEAELKYTENERDQKVLSWVDIVLKEALVEESVVEAETKAAKEGELLPVAAQEDVPAVEAKAEEVAETEEALEQIDKKTVENTGSKSQ